MKKIFTTLILLGVLAVSAQVKIGDNPTTIGSSSSLELESTNKALVLTRVANTAAVTAPVNGMIVYDISSNCIKAYENGVWTNCLSNGSNIEPSTNGTAKVNSYTCSTASAGTISVGVSVSGVTQTVTADVSQVGTYSLNCFANGVVFSGSGTFTALGSQNIVLTAIGTAVNVGNDTYTLNTLPTCSFSRTALGNPSSGGTAIVSAYVCNTASAGTPVVGTAVSGVTQTITATVTTVGTYSISATINGVTFAGNGTFTGTGAQAVVLTATGTPTTAGSNSFTLNTTPNCSFTRVVNSPTTGGTAVVSAYNCSGTATGTLTEGIAASGVTQTITATVITVGTYSITTTAVNGITWSGSGTFAGTGAQTITLTASGTPTTAGTSTFALPSTPTCSFTRSVGETFTSTLCATKVATFPSTVTVGSSNVTVTKTGTSTDGTSAIYCGITVGNSQVTNDAQFASYSFSIPVKNVQVYSAGYELGEATEGFTVIASLAGVSVPVQLVPVAIGTCNSAFTTTQSGASASMRITGSSATSSIVFNISASGVYDSVTITRVGSASTVAYNHHALAFCNATAVPNTTSGGSAVVSAYNCSGTSVGAMAAGVAVSGVTQAITATVTTVGGYNITTAPVNGITWSGSGTFAGTGTQTITLTASGTPVAAGTSTFTLSTTPNCSFNRFVNEAFTSTLCTTVGTFPATVTVGSSNVVITKTGSSANNVASSTYCGITLGNSQQTFDTQFATYAFSVPVKNVQVYGVSMESAENQEGYVVTASLAGVSVPVQLVPLSIGTCNSVFTSNQSGASGSIRNTGLTTAAGIAFNISASGAYDSITLTRVGNTAGSNNHSLGLCNATAVPNASSGGSAVVSAYSCSTASAGTMTSGTAVSGVTQIITATVTSVGTYNISTTNNGVTFAGSGTFAGTGAQNIVLTATGTPTAATASPYTYTINTTPNCSFTRTVIQNIGSISCGTTTATFTNVLTGLAIPSGYTFSLPYTSGNSYAYPGATITSSSHSGVTATASAQTLNAGSGTILFTLSGTPATNGAISFNITVANQSCTYSGITAISRVVAFSTVTASTTTTIPAGINAVTVKAWGAAGKSTGGYYGGYGTYVKATVAVTPGENLTVKVGGGGTSGTTATNGGGSNGGGGYSGVFRSTTPLIIAGGGGGSGNNDNVTPPNQCTYVYGGSAGITDGFAGGKYAAGGVPQNTLLNTGGTQTAGGTGSDGTNGGSQYQGGSGLSGGYAGGGGGGGYYGGGGGTNRLADPTGDDGGGGGAGGSSFIAVGATDVTTGEQATCVSTNTVAAPGSTDADYDATNTPAKPRNSSAGSNGRVVILYGY